MTPKIIFQDSALIVLDKPSGMIVNKAETTVGQHTVQEWVEEKFKVQSSKFKVDEELDFYNRAGIVHRLDKETSGILLIAKTPEAFIDMQRQFKEREVKKTYVALVHGLVKTGDGEIRVPVGRLPWDRTKFGVIAEGKEAATRYTVLSRFQLSATGEKLTLLELYPQTGRTHQIRVHVKYFGHPIFSDFLYAGRKTSRNDRKILPRVFLHAAKISFLHPVLKKVVSFESELPLDLTTFLKTLMLLS